MVDRPRFLKFRLSLLDLLLENRKAPLQVRLHLAALRIRIEEVRQRARVLLAFVEALRRLAELGLDFPQLKIRPSIFRKRFLELVSEVFPLR
jgi:hypothetical protein